MALLPLDIGKILFISKVHDYFPVMNPNYAIGEFGQDARRTGSRRTWVLQAPRNKEIQIKSPIPKA